MGPAPAPLSLPLPLLPPPLLPPLLLPPPLLPLLLRHSHQQREPQHHLHLHHQETLDHQPFCRASHRTTWVTWSWGASTIHRISPSRGLGGVLLLQLPSLLRKAFPM